MKKKSWDRDCLQKVKSRKAGACTRKAHLPVKTLEAMAGISARTPSPGLTLQVITGPRQRKGDFGSIRLILSYMPLKCLQDHPAQLTTQVCMGEGNTLLVKTDYSQKQNSINDLSYIQVSSDKTMACKLPVTFFSTGQLVC